MRLVLGANLSSAVADALREAGYKRQRGADWTLARVEFLARRGVSTYRRVSVGYHESVSRNVVTAAELETMTPAEQQTHFDRSVVTDLADVPEAFLDRVRNRLDQHIAQSETAPHQK